MINKSPHSTPCQDVPQYPSFIPGYPGAVEKVHLYSPHEFLPHPSETKKEPELPEVEFGMVNYAIFYRSTVQFIINIVVSRLFFSPLPLNCANFTTEYKTM